VVADHLHPVGADAVRAVKTRGLGDDRARAAAEAFGLLSDPVRARMVDALLIAEELCVGDVRQAIGASADAVSYGLRVLRTAGLVESRKVGRQRVYRFADDTTRDALGAAVSGVRSLPAVAGDRETTT
jgi:DNA-binding transcriptional ArsR family regulator